MFGPGPVGLTTVQACQALGANQVILVGTRPSRLHLGGRLGADHLVDATRTDPVRAVLDLTGGAGADLAIECSGGPGAPVTVDLTAIVRKDISLYTSRGEGGNNVRRALSLAARGRLRCAELITHRFPLAGIGEAFRVLRDRDGDPVKIVIVP